MSTQIEGLAEIQRALLAWHRANGLRAPWRETGDPYHALVAAVMAQQTQMSRVLESYARFLAAFPTLEDLAAASRGDVIRAWRGMGYNTRGVRLHEAARAIAAGGWPRDAEGLAQLRGIGPFTAAIVASFGFGAPAACIDTNVQRVIGRLADDEDARGVRLQRLADAFLAREEPARWNQAVMDYGARVCTRRPKCGDCVVAALCPSRERYEEVPRAVADERARYEAAPPVRARRPQSAYAGSARFYRGRIIQALRATAPGERLGIAALAARIGDDAVPGVEGVRALVVALERDGLAVLHARDDAVSLPEEP